MARPTSVGHPESPAIVSFSSHSRGLARVNLRVVNVARVRVECGRAERFSSPAARPRAGSHNSFRKERTKMFIEKLESRRLLSAGSPNATANNPFKLDHHEDQADNKAERKEDHQDPKADRKADHKEDQQD